MPEETKQKKVRQTEVMAIELLKPQVNGDPILIENLTPLDFENAKIFSFFEVSK